MLERLRSHLSADGYARVRAGEMRAMLGAPALAGWRDYAASWNDLATDGFMADGGRYRRRALSRGDRSGQRPAGQKAAACRDRR